MRSSLRVVTREGDEYGLLFNDAQRDAITSSLELMGSIIQPDASLEVQVGVSKARLRMLELKIRESRPDVPVDLSLSDLHVIHATLLSALNQFRTEEDFYIRIGFFRNNLRELGEGIVKVVSA